MFWDAEEKHMCFTILFTAMTISLIAAMYMPVLLLLYEWQKWVGYVLVFGVYILAGIAIGIYRLYWYIQECKYYSKKETEKRNKVLEAHYFPERFSEEEARKLKNKYLTMKE